MIGVDFTGAVEFARTQIKPMGDRAGDLRPILNAIVRNMENSVFQQAFARQGAHGGPRWAPLSAARSQFKALHGLDPRILWATHALRDSYVQRGHPDHIRVVNRASYRVGSKRPYAGAHQDPQPRAAWGGRSLPKRDIRVPRSREQEYTRAIGRYTTRGIVQVK